MRCYLSLTCTVLSPHIHKPSTVPLLTRQTSDFTYNIIRLLTG